MGNNRGKRAGLMASALYSVLKYKLSIITFAIAA